MSRRPDLRWAAVALLGASVLELSLFLQWYSGLAEEDGRYSATGWEAFHGVDVTLAAGGGLAIGCIIVTVIWRSHPPWLTAPPLLVGILATYAVVRLGLLGHADHDPALDTPEAGVYAALIASLLLAVGAGGQRGRAHAG